MVCVRIAGFRYICVRHRSGVCYGCLYAAVNVRHVSTTNVSAYKSTQFGVYRRVSGKNTGPESEGSIHSDRIVNDQMIIILCPAK